MILLLKPQLGAKDKDLIMVLSVRLEHPEKTEIGRKTIYNAGRRPEHKAS